MKKKLIGFDDELIEKIEKYGDSKKLTFTDAVRQLIITALDGVSTETTTYIADNKIDEIIEEIAKMKKSAQWFQADDTQHKISVLESAVNKLESTINTLVGVSKHFKGHLENREIHLQD